MTHVALVRRDEDGFPGRLEVEHVDVGVGTRAWFVEGEPATVAAEVAKGPGGVVLENNTFMQFIQIGFPVGQGEIPPEPLVAFIVNITFHPVPEPGTLALLAGSLMALVIARRRSE